MGYGNKSIESTTAGDSLFFKFECNHKKSSKNINPLNGYGY